MRCDFHDCSHNSSKDKIKIKIKVKDYMKETEDVNEKQLQTQAQIHEVSTPLKGAAGAAKATVMTRTAL